VINSEAQPAGTPLRGEHGQPARREQTAFGGCAGLSCFGPCYGAAKITEMELWTGGLACWVSECRERGRMEESGRRLWLCRARRGCSILPSCSHVSGPRSGGTRARGALGANTSVGWGALLAVSRAPSGDHRAGTFLEKEPAEARSSATEIRPAAEPAPRRADAGEHGGSASPPTSSGTATDRACSQLPRTQKAEATLHHGAWGSL